MLRILCEFLDERLGLPRGKFLGLDILRRIALQFRILDRDKRARLPHREAAVGNVRLHLCRELQQAEEVRDMRAAASDLFRHFLLRHAEVLHEMVIGTRFLHRVQVFTLYVLDERDFTDLRIAVLTHDRGDGGKPCKACRAQAALACDNLVAALWQAPHEQRLQDAVLLDRGA